MTAVPNEAKSRPSRTESILSPRLERFPGENLEEQSGAF
jgi:hypothetical protein